MDGVKEVKVGHTPEPWEVGPWITSQFPTPHKVYAIIRGNGRKIGSVSVYGRVVDTGEAGGRSLKSGGACRTTPEPEAEANAHRIADCVNACEGINPEAVPDLLEALKKAQWSERWEDEDGIRHNRCPICARAPRLGHSEICPIGMAIALAEGGAP